MWRPEVEWGKKNVIQWSNENNLYILKNYYQQQDEDSNSYLCVRNSLAHHHVLDGKGEKKEMKQREGREGELSVSFSYMLKVLVSCSTLSYFILTALIKLNHLSSPSSTPEAYVGIDLTIKTRLCVPFLRSLRF